MRVVPLSDEVVGERLAYPVVDDAGRVLVATGTPLTIHAVRQLIRRGYRSVPLWDPALPDAEPSDAISDDTRAFAEGSVKSILSRSASLEDGHLVERVALAVDRIVADVAANPSLAYNLSALRSVNRGLVVHAVNVTVYSVIIAMSFSLDSTDVNRVGIGALLHDIGQIYFMDLVLKPALLEPDEMERVRRHAQEGYDILRLQPGIDPRIPHIAYQHHERLDGSGYPRGLKGDDIHLWARIVSVAEVYDALTADQPYHTALRAHEAMAELLAVAGSGKLDDRAARHLAQRLASYPDGTILLLESGEVAVVLRQGPTDSGHPVVRLVASPDLRVDLSVGERVLDMQAPETRPRLVMPDYPPEVRRQLRQLAARRA